MILRAILPVALVLAAPASAQVSPGSGAVLRGLDKIDGRVEDITVGVGSTVEIGRLAISLIECRYPTDNPAGNAYAWLTIRQGDEPLFEGWMVASSPALNALDHPRYDVWVIGCNA
jgi:hypothetical protein